MDSLTFADNTTQSKGYTDTSINTLSTTALNNALTNIIPVGTILAYGGTYYDNLLNAVSPPTGYLWCTGGTISTSTYALLYTAIGDRYKYGRTLAVGLFYLPDLRGATLKGCGTNSNFTLQTGMTFQGEYQQCNAGEHYHTYTDRGVDNKNVGAGATSAAVKGSNGTYNTGSATYSTSGSPLDADTRVNSVGVNYIIKF
jgi:microcystin-dependent protein